MQTHIQKNLFSECLQFIPFRDEKQIWEKLNGIFISLEEEIRKVKTQVMEYLQSTEEARLISEEAMKNQEIADELDPEGEQDKVDCELLHPDFEHLNPEDLDLQDERKKAISNSNQLK